jgi:hypothetical protein
MRTRRVTANLTAAIKEIAANDPDNLKIKGSVLIEQGLADTTVLPPLDQQLSQELAKNGAKDRQLLLRARPLETAATRRCPARSGTWR